MRSSHSVTGSERSPAGLRNMLVIVRQKAIGASMSVSTPPLDCGLQRSTGKRMIWPCNAASYLRQTSALALTASKLRSCWSEAESQLATSPTALNKAWADQVGRLVVDGMIEIGAGALARLVLAKCLFGLIEGHCLTSGTGLGLKAADKPVSSQQLEIGKRVLIRLVPNCSRDPSLVVERRSTAAMGQGGAIEFSGPASYQT